MVTKNDFVYVKSPFVFGQFSNIKSTIVQTAMLLLPSDLSCFLPHYTDLSFCELEMQTGPKLFICEALGCICQRFLLTKYEGGEVDVARYGKDRRGTNISV